MRLIIFLITGTLITLISAFISQWLQRSKKELLKTTPYECGEATEVNPIVVIHPNYLAITIVFLLFEVELLLLLPWVMGKGHWSGVFFLVVLLIGYGYAWWRGDLTWLPRREPRYPKLYAPLSKAQYEAFNRAPWYERRQR